MEIRPHFNDYDFAFVPFAKPYCIELMILKSFDELCSLICAKNIIEKHTKIIKTRKQGPMTKATFWKNVLVKSLVKSHLN